MDKERFKNKIVNNEKENLVEQIKKEVRPIILFGGGSLSYSVRRILKEAGVQIAACWIDNAEIDMLGDIKVMSYDDICKEFNEFVVVFGHAKYEMAETIINRKEIQKCYCLVNVCYGQWEALKYSFVEEHLDEYYKTYTELEDDFSRECMIGWLNTRISEDYRYLVEICNKETATYFDNPFFEVGKSEYLVDVGAYVGDTIAEFLKNVDGYKKILAIEPEEESYSRLTEYVERNMLKDVKTHKVGLWNCEGKLSFGIDEESSSLAEQGDDYIYVKKLDDMIVDEDVTLIKFNYLYGVYEGIEGASKLLQKRKPKLRVMVGFDEWGIIRIPQLIKKINSDYKLSLRFASAMPARLILFAY